MSKHISLLPEAEHPLVNDTPIASNIGLKTPNTIQP